MASLAWTADVLACCRNLAIDIRKCRDVCQAPAGEPGSVASNLGSHLSQLLDILSLLDEAAHSELIDGASKAKQIALVMVQLLGRLGKPGEALDVRAKLSTLNTALAGKVKVSIVFPSCLLVGRFT